MWVFLMMVCLLDQNQAAPLPRQQGSLQHVLQQLDQTTPSSICDDGQQRTSSSSSSSSSSVSSESSQSSEEPQKQLSEGQNLENTAVEQVDSSQESSALLPSPSNSTSLWLNELVSLGEVDTGDASAASRERRNQALVSTFHHLLSPPRLGGRGLVAVAEGGVATGEGGVAIGEGGVATGEGGVAIGEGGVATGEGGVAIGEEIDSEFPRLLDDSTETADAGLTFDHAHHHGYHGNEAGLSISNQSII